MVLPKYNLFTRRQQHGETFKDWYCELKRLFDPADAENITSDDLLTVLITTGIRNKSSRLKTLENYRNRTLDQTLKLIETRAELASSLVRADCS